MTVAEPAQYAKWAREAHPRCKICRETGVAQMAYVPGLKTTDLRFLDDPPKNVPLEIRDTRCRCSKPPKAEKAKHEKALPGNLVE